MPLRSVNPHVVQLGKFVAVGLFNTAFSYSVYAVLLYLGLGYALANLIALVFGIMVSFKMQGMLVFGNTENRRIVRFVIAWSFIYAFNIFIISRFIAAGFGAYASGALAIPFATVLSYLAQKFFVFAKSRSAAGS